MNRVFLVEEKDVPAVRLQGAIEEAGSDEPVIHKDDQVINGDDFIFSPRRLMVTSLVYPACESEPPTTTVFDPS